MSDHPATALRAPTVLKAPEVSRRGSLAGTSHRGRNAALAALIVALLAVAGFLSWSALLKPVMVSVLPAQSGLQQQVFGLGTVGARVQSNVGFKVPGVLVALNADQGDRVKAGQVLAQLDARDIEAQIRVMKAGVVQARANLEKARADVLSAAAALDNAKAISSRRSTLAAHGFASQEEAQTNEATVRVDTANLAAAKSGVGVAEAALQSAQAQEEFEQATLANYTLTAPYDAWVVSRNLELGASPNPGQAVFTLVAAHSIWALGYVDERLAGRLAVGQPAEIVLRSDPGLRLAGHVARIEVQSDAINEERLVDVAFDQIPENIHLAEQAEVVITTGALPRTVAVPPTAVTELRDGHGWVWTVEHDRIDRREVTFGSALLDGRLPVVDGLPADAEVVAASVTGLRVGRAVHVAAAVQR
jgi:HlyD family secretion protein